MLLTEDMALRVTSTHGGKKHTSVIPLSRLLLAFRELAR